MIRKLCLASLLSLLATGPAWAHAHLQTAVPPVGGVATAVHDIRLSFSEGVEPKFSSITLSTAAGQPVTAPAATVDPKDASILVLHLAADLPPGAYKVKWAVVPVDNRMVPDAETEATGCAPAALADPQPDGGNLGRNSGVGRRFRVGEFRTTAIIRTSNPLCQRPNCLPSSPPSLAIHDAKFGHAMALGGGENSRDLPVRRIGVGA